MDCDPLPDILGSAAAPITMIDFEDELGDILCTVADDDFCGNRDKSVGKKAKKHLTRKRPIDSDSLREDCSRPVMIVPDFRSIDGDKMARLSDAAEIDSISRTNFLPPVCL